MTNVDIHVKDRVMVIAMNRQERENRITQAMAERMASALREARDSTDVDACVVTGTGAWFSTGGDYQGAKAGGGRAGFAQAFANLHHAMDGLGKPLVAAVNGDAHAGGFSLVIACDMAVMSEDATLALPEAAHGFFPLLALAAVRNDLPKKLLYDMVYSGRSLSPEEGRANHLVNEIVPAGRVMKRAVELARMAAGHNPEVTKVGRDLYYAMRGMDPRGAFDASRFALFAAYDAWDKSDRAS